MFSFFRPKYREMTPQQVHDALAAKKIVLVDVREANEHAGERIRGAICQPLSSFDPRRLPKGNVVLHCAFGRRSAMALAKCKQAGVAVDTHMTGGLASWKAAGLHTVSG